MGSSFMTRDDAARAHDRATIAAAKNASAKTGREPRAGTSCRSRVLAHGAVVLARHVERAVAIVVAGVEAPLVLAQHAGRAIAVAAAVRGAHAAATVRPLEAAEQRLQAIAIVVAESARTALAIGGLETTPLGREVVECFLLGRFLLTTRDECDAEQCERCDAQANARG